MTPPDASIKARARQIIDELPDESGWDELLYRLFVVAKIERGLADAREDRTLSHDEVLREFGLSA